MIYEISNPSDPYTMKCDDFKVAAVAVLLLGRGAYVIEGTPVLIALEDIALEEFIPAHRNEIALALESVMIGSKADREQVEIELQGIPVDDRDEWLAERHHRIRSSLNDIRSKAQRLADSLRVAQSP